MDNANPYQPVTHITDSILLTLLQLSEVITQLTSVQYAQHCQVLSGASIGQHVRHTIELFTCLQQGYETGTVNYEDRKRDYRIETDPALAAAIILDIVQCIDKLNKELILVYSNGSESMQYMHTNYHRELLYNLEHAIHHMALIRIGINAVVVMELPDSFGVAPSTLQYRNTCAQ
jgi:hypothetical protein